MNFDVGSTSKSMFLFVGDDAGAPVTGLNAASFPPVFFCLAGANPAVSIPLSDLALITTAWASGGLKELGNGNYRIDLPNDCFVTAGIIIIYGGTSGKQIYPEMIQVTADLLSAIKNKTDNLPGNPAAVGSQMNLVDAPNATAIAAIVTAIMNGGSIDGASLQGVLRLIAAATIGKVAGLPGTSITQRAINDSKVRLTLTLDSNGNITNVVTDAT